MKLVNREQFLDLIEKDSQKNHYDKANLLLSAALGMFEEITKNKIDEVLIVCGNNASGDIGLLLADLLVKKSSVRVEIAHFTIENSKYQKKIEEDNIFVYSSLRDIKRVVERANFIVDCIAGSEQKERIAYPYDLFIEWINNSGAFVLSCDVPSGLDVDNGAVLGACVQANESFCLQLPKLGMYLYPGNTYCGKIILENIGISQESIENLLCQHHISEYNDIKKKLPVRVAHSHKGTYGKVLLVAGHENTVGASALCGKTIMKTGAGLLTILSYKEVIDVYKVSLPEVMTITLEDNIIYQLEHFDFSRFDLIVIGPGLSRDKKTEILLQYVLRTDKNVLIDADGLYYLKNNLELLKRDKLTVITPHLVEYQRVFDYDASRILTDLSAILKIYQNLVIVLKSENTIVAYRDKVNINTCGNNALAKGGSGDVLAGCISGFLAQRADYDSVVAGVFVHSKAADYWVKDHSHYSLLASDLIDCIDKVLFEMTNEEKR